MIKPARKDRTDIYRNMAHGDQLKIAKKLGCSKATVRMALIGKGADNYGIIKEAEMCAAINIWKTGFCKFKSELDNDFEKTYPLLTVKELQAVKVLNFVAAFDGIMEDGNDRRLILKRGIQKFIHPKRQYLLALTETAYPIRIKYKGK